MPDMKLPQARKGVGIDLVETSRFLKHKKKEDAFLKKVFTKEELEYCFSYKNPHVHLAGFFALKEAVSKALGVEKYPFAEVEVRHLKNGAPIAYHLGKKLSVSVSISHTDSLAVAIAVA